jgi:Ca-activated chloride channel family protein
VILFSDEQPNVGATEPTAFEQMVAGAAEADVHTTVLGLGLGLGPEVMRAMASLRGANAFSLTRLDHVAELMADDYPWFTTPIAFDLRVNVALEAGWSIERGLGFPAADDESAIGLKADTVFLSRRKGALLVALEAPGSSPAGLAGGFTLSYRDVTGEEVDDETPFFYDNGALDERGQWFAQHGVARTAALGLFTEGMHAAAAAYAEGSAEEAEAIMRAAQQRFAADAEALGDADLPVEVELGAALLALIEDRAEQGTLYPE